MYCLISIATNALFIYYNIEKSCLPSTINESCCGDLIQKSAILIRVSPHFKYFWLFLIFNKPLLCTDYFYVRDDLQINRNRSNALSHQVSIVERRGRGTYSTCTTVSPGPAPQVFKPLIIGLVVTGESQLYNRKYLCFVRWKLKFF